MRLNQSSLLAMVVGWLVAVVPATSHSAGSAGSEAIAPNPPSNSYEAGTAGVILYGVNATDDGLSRIDSASGQSHFIGRLSSGVATYTAPSAMAIRPSDGKIFVWNNGNGAAGGKLLTVNPETGRATPVSLRTLPQGELSALAFVGEQLYGADRDLFAIDADTGLVERVMSFGDYRVAGADAPDSGTIYAITFDQKLVTVDVQTSSITKVVSLSTKVGTPGSLACDPLTHAVIGSATSLFQGGILFDVDPGTGKVSNLRSVSPVPQGMDFTTPAPLPLYGSLHIEDAPEGVPVNKLVGDVDGPADQTCLDIVVELTTSDAAAKDDIPVTLTIPGDVFGPPSDTWVRTWSDSELTPVPFDNAGPGQYRVTTDLVRIIPTLPRPLPLSLWRRQIVWRFWIPNKLSPREVQVTANIDVPCERPIRSGTVRILARGAADTLVITNRTLLYEGRWRGGVDSLLGRLYTEMQGPPSGSRTGVVYCVDSYSSAALLWDNTAVTYTSQATANIAADEIDELIEDWNDDATQYYLIAAPELRLEFLRWMASPRYLLIVGDDDTIPFYRYDDPSNHEGIAVMGPCPQGWCVDSLTNPAIHATDEDFFFTDNPYADVRGSNWQDGDIELAVGRILGDSAADMLSLLREGVDSTNGRQGGAVMASVDGWELGLEPDTGILGEIADLCDATSLLRDRDFVVRNDDVPSTEVRTIDVLDPYETGWNAAFTDAANDSAGMDLFFIGGHDSYDRAVIPGDDFSPDDTPGKYTRFGTDHPVAMIVGCHGGLPVPDIDVPGGVDHCMVYDLIHEGARAYIGASGFSYGSPGNLHRCTWGERLMQDFFDKLLAPATGESQAIGAAMKNAKRDYAFGFGSNAALDQKTVTEYNLFGVPWISISYPLQFLPIVKPVLRQGFIIKPGPISPPQRGSIYTRTFEVEIIDYNMVDEYQDDILYELVSIPGGETAVSDGLPMLPYIQVYTLPMPEQARIVNVQILDPNTVDIGKHNIPIAQVLPFSLGGLTYTTKTDIAYPFPRDRDLVQYQETSEGALLTFFPFQHNPQTDETLWFRYLTIEVTYDAPVTVDIGEFVTDKPRYLPGEPIEAKAQISNIAHADVTLIADVVVTDMFGRTVASQTTKDFTVPSGGSFDLLFNWSSRLPDGMYTVQLLVSNRGEVVGVASTRVNITSGSIVDVTVPVGQDVVEVTVDNPGTGVLNGQLTVAIRDTETGISLELPAQTVVVEPMSSQTVALPWIPDESGSGRYHITATVTVPGDSFGAEVVSFSADVDVDLVANPEQ